MAEYQPGDSLNQERIGRAGFGMTYCAAPLSRPLCDTGRLSRRPERQIALSERPGRSASVGADHPDLRGAGKHGVAFSLAGFLEQPGQHKRTAIWRPESVGSLLLTVEGLDKLKVWTVDHVRYVN